MQKVKQNPLDISTHGNSFKSIIWVKLFSTINSLSDVCINKINCITYKAYQLQNIEQLIFWVSFNQILKKTVLNASSHDDLHLLPLNTKSIDLKLTTKGPMNIGVSHLLMCDKNKGAVWFNYRCVSI